ncbi:3-carboxy-cis,cis-muconate cycloisomerase [Panacibacter ginsenosidivorans]|uniref:3-carboxy-cis,cis-muconate cycloisomerase n=1 Tax=Panacibacter ginsenosidivorans TaxID=1813871 RepID=A0A5B8V6G4_9BACT|nr:3-carboxy-cis,cis-muconate cycloisomerase [Panacibacter ginsenosidivorans]QEC66862.1 3-carboxy-cis,cis-muconate cycloisomerase [Panacibacter ginsenosidivorans]
MQRLYENLFYNKQVNEIFTTESFIRYMLQFEAELANAQAKHNLIPPTAAQIIEENCTVSNINIETLISEVAAGGNAAIPLIKQLTHAVKTKDTEAAKYVHLGATSQDVIDTAITLQLRDALKIIEKDLQQLINQLVSLIEVHRNTIMIGRSFMQHARPITFGFKVSCWLDGLLRSKQRVVKLLAEQLPLQLGGAVGTLSGMQDKGLQVAETMSALLRLNIPAIPWHTQRDRFTETATTLGILSGNIGKIAKDISLLMQTEIAEVFEPSVPGKGGSSTMPHKRNPVGSIAILANTQRIPNLVATMLSCMVQDHERATGNWHAEWETLTDIVQLTAGTVHQACIITNGLEVDTAKMCSNIELTNGLIYAENISLALAEHIGKSDAHTLMETLCKEAVDQKIHLKELVEKNDTISRYLSLNDMQQLFSSDNALGLCNAFIDRVISPLI